VYPHLNKVGISRDLYRRPLVRATIGAQSIVVVLVVVVIVNTVALKPCLAL